PLLGETGGVPARIPRALSRDPHQLHHSGLGQPGHGQNPDADPRGEQERGAHHRARHHRCHVVHLHVVGFVGSTGHGPVSTRPEDVDGHRAGRICRAGCRRHRRAETEAGRRGSSQGGGRRPGGIGVELRARPQFGLDAHDHLSGVCLGHLVVHMVSRFRTGCRWLRCATCFYRRFVHKDASEKHYVGMSQVATVFLTIVSAIMTYYMDSIAGAWKLLIVTGAGTGTVLILRWYWWRINAWSEVSAMVAAFVASFTLQLGFGLNSDDPYGFAYIMLITVGITTVVWLA